MFSFLEPKSTKDRRNIRELLADYPVYAPPCTGKKNTSDGAEENFKHFMNTRNARIERLALFFQKFSIELNLNNKAISELSNWLFRYSGHLVPKEYHARLISSITVYDPAWTDELRGMNVVNDLGTFICEFIIQENKNTRWVLYTGYGKMPAQKPMNFNHPCIFNLGVITGTMPYDPVIDIWEACEAGRFRLSGNNSGLNQWDKPMYFMEKMKMITDEKASLAVPYLGAQKGNDSIQRRRN